MNKNLEKPNKKLFSRDFFRLLKEYVGAGAGVPEARDLQNPASLGEFLDSRASHVAQTTLYGYMKTRAGTRFPELFEDPGILAAINIAKWHIWLACLSDLTVYSGVLLRLRSDESPTRIRALLRQIVVPLVARVGVPEEAGDDFPAAARRLEARIATADLEALQDDDSAFTESPKALVYWSPVADELKSRDVEIVRNSVRFRWQEVRRSLRRRLRAHALLQAAENSADLRLPTR